MNPSCAPTTAATRVPSTTAARFKWGSPALFVAQKAPASTRMESPGNGTGSNPDSTKTMRIRPIVPNVSMRSLALSQFTPTIRPNIRKVPG
jgi:hypothetical protein